MFIGLTDDFRIEASAGHYVVQQRHVAEKDTKARKAGDEWWSPIGYYTQLSAALQRSVLAELEDDDETVGLRQYVERYTNAAARLRSRVDAAMKVTGYGGIE